MSGSGLAMKVDERHPSSSGGHVKSTIVTSSLENSERSVMVAVTPGVQKSWARTRKRSIRSGAYVRLNAHLRRAAVLSHHPRPGDLELPLVRLRVARRRPARPAS